MPPPPINTGAAPYPQGGNPYGQPPGYPPNNPAAYTGAYAPQGPQSYTRPGAGVAEVEGAGRSKAQLIVGIDFGTTFSGVAFAFATNTEAKEDIITEWPGAGNQTKQKVRPSQLPHSQDSLRL